MNRAFLSIVLLLLFLMSASAQQQQHVADSIMSVRTLNDLIQIFPLTTEQQTAVYQAGITANQARRNVFTNYWQTDSFKVKLSAAIFLKDSLYRSVLGSDNLRIYRDTLMRRGKTW